MNSCVDWSLHWVPSHVSGRVWVKNGPSAFLGFHLPRGPPVANFPEVIRASLASNILKATRGL